jgi:hypothetical protein
MWLTGRLAPDFKTIADFRKDNGAATSGRGSGVVGYNVQAAVDARHHLIVAHEVTNVGHDRGQLSTMPEQITACKAAGMNDHIAKPIYLADLLGKIAYWSSDVQPTEGLSRQA